MEIKEEDLIEEVEDFDIDKSAFEGPLNCAECKTKMKKIKTSMWLADAAITIHFSAWKCPKCEAEMLDFKQAKKLDNLLNIEHALLQKGLSFERVVNFDGQSFFVRFPAEISKGWTANLKADIKPLSGTDFLVKVHK